jgi:hypothetical protein
MNSETGLSATSIVARNTEILEAELDGEVMALNVENGICYGFNKIGSRIWKILAEPGRVSDLCARLIAEYEVDEATCERQVLDLLEELRGGGLVELSPGAPQPGTSPA